MNSIRSNLKQVLIKTCKSKTAVIAAILLILYTVTGFFLLPSSIEHFLPKILSQRLDSEVSLKEVKINPFTLTVEAREFQIREPSGGPIVGFDRLYVNFQLSSIFRWALTFEDVSLDDPSVNIVINKDGGLNLDRLAGQEPGAPTKEEKKRPLRMLLRNIAINQGVIDVTDNRQPIPATVSFHPLDVHLSDISTLPEREGDYILRAVTGDGANLEWSGQISLNPIHSEGILALMQLPMTTPWEFIRSHLNIDPPEGFLDLHTSYVIDLGQETPVAILDDLRLELTRLGLNISGTDEACLDLPRISVNAGKLDMIQRRIDGVDLAITGGKLNLITDRDGILNLQRLTSGEPYPESPPPLASDEQEAPWTVTVPAVDLKGLVLNYTDQSRTPALSFSTDGINLACKADITTGSSGVQVLVDDLGLTLLQISLGFTGAPRSALKVATLALTGGSFDLGARTALIAGLELTDGGIDVIRNEDNTINLLQIFETDSTARSEQDKDPPAGASDPWQFLVETVSLSGFKTRVTDVTVNRESPIIGLEDISMNLSRFDGKAPTTFETDLRVVQGGTVKASGSFDPAAASVDSSITIKDLALPVAQPYLARMADLTLNSGLFSTEGTFKRTAKGGMAYQGHLGIACLRIIENITKDTLLGWRQLGIPDFRLNLNPNSLEIKRLKLTGLEGKLIISEDRKVNVVEAFKAPPGKAETKFSTEPVPEEPPSKTDTEPFPVRIGNITLDSGTLQFADLSLMPRFATKIYELKGDIVGLSSSPAARTQVSMDGRVDEYGSSKIRGEINAFDPKQFTDITMVFHNLEMTNLTPYSGKFAGRKIDDGKLSLDLEYKIEDSRLLSNNKIVIDSLKLGERVESPDAVSLPLDLAIALLRDANGIINIGIPITGTLDDPEFRYGPIVWKALVNLLTKIATSPFRALGALLGAGEETLNTVNFEPGSGDIPLPEQEKLSMLLKALRERPQLKLIITGRYHSDADGQAIRELQVRQALAESSGTPLKPGNDPGPVDFSNPEIEKKLAALFVSRNGEEAFNTLNAEAKPPEKKTKGSEAVAEDPGALAKRLFSELVKSESLEANVLRHLADERAQAIVSYMTSPVGLSPERIEIKQPEITDADDSLSSDLALNAM